MTDNDTRQPITEDIRVAVDTYGDPYLIVNVETPAGTMLSAEMADALALKILAASAAARMRASVVRGRLMAGDTPQEAIRHVNEVIPHP